MKTSVMRVRVAVLAVALTIGTVCMSVAAAPWTSRFDPVVGGVPRQAYSPPPRISAGPDGAFFAYNYQEPTGRLAGVARLDHVSATPLWSAMDPQDFGGPSDSSSFVALADGSSILLANRLSRFDPDGTLLWSVPVDSVADAARLEVGDVLLATLSDRGIRVQRLLVGTGATVEVIHVPQFAQCSEIHLVAATADTGYLSCRGVGMARISTNPLRVVWSVDSSTFSIAADANAVYEHTGGLLRRRAVSDGATQWEVPRSATFPAVQLDAAGNLITRGATIERRDAATGSVMWASSESGQPRLDTSRQGIYFVETLGVSGNPTQGRVGRIDLATGATLWALETPVAQTAAFDDVAASTSRVAVIGSTCTAPFDAPCMHSVWTTSSGGDALIASPLSSRSSTSGGAVIEDAAHSFAVATEWGLQGPQAHLRTLANTTGGHVQDTVTPFIVAPTPHADLGWRSNHLLHATRTTNDHVFATYSTNSLPLDESIVNATLLKIDRSDGSITWQKFFIESDRMAVVTNPIVDSTGNVVIGVIEHYWPHLALPERRWVRKFSGTDGSLLWEREFPFDPLTATFNYPPGIAAIGDNVGVFDAPLGSGHRRFTSLSGIDGSTQWSLGSDQFIETIGPNGLITRLSGMPLRFARINPATGASIWTSTIFDGYPDQSYSINNIVHGDDGDLYAGGTVRTFDLVLNQVRTIGILLRLDGNDGHLVWGTRLDTNPVWPTSRVNPRAMSDGRIYATQPLGGTLGYALTAFSANTGDPLGSGYLYSSSIDQPHVSQQSEQGIFDVSPTPGTLAAGQHYDAGSPGALVVSNLGGPFPGPTGALRIDLDATPSSAGAAISYALELDVHNDGPTAVDDVRVLLALPPATILGTTTCFMAGTPCDATVTATSIEGEFSIPAGASIRITSQATLAGGSRPLRPDRFSAYAFAPHPFTEANLQDNQAARSYSDVVFQDDFEE
ncbi:MAG: hypothetical protein J0L88_01320 [Xanthomonadales bacterium]|nr:hypothetical protein [Xanthomonadales bacterium]